MPGNDEVAASLTSLVARAREGDRQAWASLVGRLERVVWKATYAFDLSKEDRDEAFQNTWLRFFERLATIDDPERLPGWLTTTTKREVLGLLRRRQRLVPVGGELREPLPQQPEGDERLMKTELTHAVRLAFGRLQPVCQRLLRMLTIDPFPGYAAVAELLGTTTGYIGPTRQRCLQQLRSMPELRPFLDERSTW